MKARVGAVLMLLAGLAACQQGPTEEQMAEKNQEPLNKKEVQNIMTDITGYATNSKGTDIIIYRSPNGSVRGKAIWSGGSEIDKGQWKVRDDGIMCTEWGKWLNGQEVCYKLYDTGHSIIFTNTKGPGENYTVPKSNIKDGNVEDL